MRVNFLTAVQPITKSYTKNKHGITKNPYPFIYEVTSTEHVVTSAEALYPLVVDYAHQGSCLLKGELTRPLVSESRAGTTDSKAKTEWICLDVDGLDGYSTVDNFLQDIGCGDTDYVLQWSASQGVDGNSALRCHVFMLLDAPRTPEILKRWLTTLNLTVPRINDQLKLTRTNCSLRWGLDITTCQNDKLLYIAPPVFTGMDDPLGDAPRISLVKNKHRKLTIKTPVLEREAIRHLAAERINELRVAAHMPKRRNTKMKVAGSVEYMPGPDTATVTEMKAERGYVYLNLNGGDSWAYYHPADNSTFIYNFKGEPAYRTEELLPEYWAELTRDAREYRPNAQGTVYLAFREFRTGLYYNGMYDSATNRLNMAVAKSEAQLKSFLKSHGQTVGDFIPDWDLIFNPMDPEILNVEDKQVNVFLPSVYMENRNPPKVRTLPTVTARVISHALGNDPDTYEAFLNWFACVLQYRDRTGTAWIFQGIQGTGKGLMFHNVMAPLLGEHNTVAKRMEELEGEFTGFIENKLLTNIDEIEVGSSVYHSKITAKLKNLIVEPNISIRKMYAPAYMARNYNNMVFSSNKTEPVQVDPDDRRFNVAPYQTEKLEISSKEIDLIETELSNTYAYFMHREADRDMARTPLRNEARETLMDIGRTAIDAVSDALLKGDFKFFWDLLPATKPADTGLIHTDHFRYKAYRDLIVRAIAEKRDKLSRDDLFVLYDWCDGKTPRSPNKFTALLKHHRIHLKSVWMDGRTVRGMDVRWDFSDTEWVEAVLKEIATNAV